MDEMTIPKLEDTVLTKEQRKIVEELDLARLKIIRVVESKASVWSKAFTDDLINELSGAKLDYRWGRVLSNRLRIATERTLKRSRVRFQELIFTSSKQMHDALVTQYSKIVPIKQDDIKFKIWKKTLVSIIDRISVFWRYFEAGVMRRLTELIVTANTMVKAPSVSSVIDLLIMDSRKNAESAQKVIPSSLMTAYQTIWVAETTRQLRKSTNLVLNRMWLAHQNSSSLCDTCRNLHGKILEPEVPFKNAKGESLFGPPLHPACMCHLVLVVSNQTTNEPA
jgi:hypothetical protein